MHACRFLLLLVSCSLLSLSTAAAQRITRLFPNNITIRGISLSDYSHSIAVGDSATILICRDTGGDRSWYPLAPPCDRSQTLYGVSYFDTTHAAIVGDHGLIFYTSDAGSSWQRSKNPFTDQTLRGISNTPEGLIVVGDSGIVFRSSDRGANWIRISSNTTHNINGVAFNGAGIGYFVGEHGLIGKSRDFGRTWTNVTDTIKSLYPARALILFHAVAMTDGDTALAVGDSGCSARTVDGNPRRSLALIHFSGADSGRYNWWLSVLRRWSLLTVLYSGRGAYPWSIFGNDDLQLGLDDSNHIFFTPLTFLGDADGGADTASIQGNCSTIWRGKPHAVTQYGGPSETLGTSNNGVTTSFGSIEPQNLGFGNVLFTSIKPNGYGFGTGVGGSFGRTTDNGLTWRDNGEDLYDVSLKATDIYTIDSNNAIAAGWSGRIYRTKDGGKHWTTRLVDSLQPRLHAISFPSPANGVIVGDYGTALRSTDSGASWKNVDLGFFTDYLLAVAFSSGSVGIAVGSNGSILRTSDEGLKWTPVQNPLTPASPNDPTHSYRSLVGFSNGYIMRVATAPDCSDLKTMG